jgi:Galactosyltransferase
MIATKTLVLILSCEHYADRRDACRETWLQERHCQSAADVRCVFVVGRPGRSASLAGDTLYVDTPDSYQDLSLKTHAAIREALTRWDFQWLFKCDDDTLVNLPRLAAYPRDCWPRCPVDYIGRKVNLHGNGNGGYGKGWSILEVAKRERHAELNHDRLESMKTQTWLYSPWADGGSGYFLSRHASGLVASEPLIHVQRFLYEDAFVGSVMYANNIQLWGEHVNFRPKVTEYTAESMFGAVTLHPFAAETMRRIYWRLYDAGEMGS